MMPSLDTNTRPMKRNNTASKRVSLQLPQNHHDAAATSSPVFEKRALSRKSMPARLRKSKHIPIVPSDTNDTADLQQQQEQQILAEHRDYVFYRRVLQGMQQTQRRSMVTSHTSMPSPCYYENQHLISHVFQMRHSDPEIIDVAEDFSCSYYSSEDDVTASLVQDDEDDDDCIFHLEL